jgi:hypothetical protein
LGFGAEIKSGGNGAGESSSEILLSEESGNFGKAVSLLIISKVNGASFVGAPGSFPDSCLTGVKDGGSEAGGRGGGDGVDGRDESNGAGGSGGGGDGVNGRGGVFSTAGAGAGACTWRVSAFFSGGWEEIVFIALNGLDNLGTLVSRGFEGGGGVLGVARAGKDVAVWFAKAGKGDTREELVALANADGD